MALTVQAELSGRSWVFHCTEHWANIQIRSLALNFWSLQLRFSTERRSKVLIFRGFRSDDSLQSSFAKMPFLKDNLLPLLNQTSSVSHLQGWGKGKNLSEQFNVRVTVCSTKSCAWLVTCEKSACLRHKNKIRIKCNFCFAACPSCSLSQDFKLCVTHGCSGPPLPCAWNRGLQGYCTWIYY